MKDKNKIIKIIAIVIDVTTILFAFIKWFKLPDVIPAHYNSLMQPDRYGNKTELIIVILSPILGMIPWKGNKKEYHCTDEETVKKATEEQKKTTSITQLIVSIVSCLIVWVIVLMATTVR